MLKKCTDTENVKCLLFVKFIFKYFDKYCSDLVILKSIKHNALLKCFIFKSTMLVLVCLQYFLTLSSFVVMYIYICMNGVVRFCIEYFRKLIFYFIIFCIGKKKKFFLVNVFLLTVVSQCY